MADEVEELRADMDAKYRRAALFSLPMGVAVALLLLEIYIGVAPFGAGAWFLILVCGMAIAVVPMMRVQRAKRAYTIARTKARLAALQREFEPEVQA